MVQLQQHLDGCELGGRGSCWATVVVKGNTGDRPTALALGRKQQRSPSRVLRGHLGAEEVTVINIIF